jgi:hypothetical protein
MSNSNLNKLVKVDNEGNVHEIFSEYYVNMPENHAGKNPMDHPDGSIVTSKLRDGAVTTEKIKDQNVTTEKINDEAVVTSKIKDQNVTDEKLSDSLNLITKSVYVATPWATGNGNGSEPDSPVVSLDTTYTRAVIDQKLDLKSDKDHIHNKDGITDLTTDLNNLESLINTKAAGDHKHDIQEIENVDSFFDGHIQNILEMVIQETGEYLDVSFYKKTEIDEQMNGKSNADHAHTNIDEKIQELENIIESLTQKIEALETVSTGTAKFIPNSDPGPAPDGYTAIWVE